MTNTITWTEYKSVDEESNLHYVWYNAVLTDDEGLELADGGFSDQDEDVDVTDEEAYRSVEFDLLQQAGLHQSQVKVVTPW